MESTMTRLQGAALAAGILALGVFALAGVARAQDGASEFGHPQVPRLDKGDTDGRVSDHGIIEGDDWDVAPIRSLTTMAEAPLEFITMAEAALGVTAMLPEADYWVFARGSAVSPQEPGLVRLLGGVGDEAPVGQPMEAGLYANLTARSIGVEVGGDLILIDPGDALAVGVEDATFHGEVGVECDGSFYACCRSTPNDDGKYAFCKNIHESDDECESGGKGSTGCTITPTRKRIGV